MKTKSAIKMVLVGTLIVLVGYWVRGHDWLAALMLSSLAIMVGVKLVFAIRSRRRQPPPEGYDPGSADRPVPRPPGGGPPALSAAADPENRRAA